MLCWAPHKGFLVDVCFEVEKQLTALLISHPGKSYWEPSRKRRISWALQPRGAEHSLILWCPTFDVSIVTTVATCGEILKRPEMGQACLRRLSWAVDSLEEARQSRVRFLNWSRFAVKTHFEQIARALQSPKVGRIPKPRCEFARWERCQQQWFIQNMCLMYVI